jgi:hypothetical protein
MKRLLILLTLGISVLYAGSINIAKSIKYTQALYKEKIALIESKDNGYSMP